MTLDPRDGDEREHMMQSDVLLVAIAGVSLLQGMPWSPTLFPVLVLLKALLAGSILGTPLVVTYLASMLASAMTVAVAGAPVAVYERVVGMRRSSALSLSLWLFGVIALVALPHVLMPR